PSERSISTGVRGFLGGYIPSLAHELAHFIDSEAGAAQGLNIRAYRGEKRVAHDSSYVSDVHYRQGDPDGYGLYRDAVRKMSDSWRIQRVARLKQADVKDQPELQDEYDYNKVKLGAYWREPVEVFARLVEQYIGTKLQRGGFAADAPEKYEKMPGYWRKEEFAALEPRLEQQLRVRLEMLGHDHSQLGKVTPAKLKQLDAKTQGEIAGVREAGATKATATRAAKEAGVAEKPTRQAVAREEKATTRTRRAKGPSDEQYQDALDLAATLVEHGAPAAIGSAQVNEWLARQPYIREQIRDAVAATKDKGGRHSKVKLKAVAADWGYRISHDLGLKGYGGKVEQPGAADAEAAKKAAAMGKHIAKITGNKAHADPEFLLPTLQDPAFLAKLQAVHDGAPQDPAAANAHHVAGLKKLVGEAYAAWQAQRGGKAEEPKTLPGLVAKHGLKGQPSYDDPDFLKWVGEHPGAQRPIKEILADSHLPAAQKSRLEYFLHAWHSSYAEKKAAEEQAATVAARKKAPYGVLARHVGLTGHPAYEDAAFHDWLSEQPAAVEEFDRTIRNHPFGTDLDGRKRHIDYFLRGWHSRHQEAQAAQPTPKAARTKKAVAKSEPVLLVAAAAPGGLRALLAKASDHWQGEPRDSRGRWTRATGALRPLHEASDHALVRRLARDIAAHGWEGAPLVADGAQLLTGSHRYAAVKRLGWGDEQIPVTRLEDVLREAGVSLWGGLESTLEELRDSGEHPSRLAAVAAIVNGDVPGKVRRKYGLDLDRLALVAKSDHWKDEPRDGRGRWTAEERAANLRDWFAGSKIANDDGTPKVVYHGTSAGQDFAAFKVGKRGQFGAGVYFTDVADYAAHFAGGGADETHGDSPRLVPVYLRIRNPYVWGSDPNIERLPEKVRDKEIRRKHDGIVVPPA
ncbi:MAG: hypothetical protein KGL54_11750, partial [Sphingomonadales bacterium]|nr:hypothetical protein [Sphingomonadales bacterium]